MIKNAEETNKEKGKVSFIVNELGKNITSFSLERNERKTINKSYCDSFVLFGKTAEAIRVMKTSCREGELHLCLVRTRDNDSRVKVILTAITGLP
jgi:hypothetical protein